MFAEQMLPRARERLATISGAAPVKDAAALMAKPHTDLVVVCGGDGGMAGVVTKTDIVGQVIWCVSGGCTARVDVIMTRDVASCRPDEPLQGNWLVMKARGLQRIPVLDGNRKSVGIIYARDRRRQAESRRRPAAAGRCIPGEVTAFWRWTWPGVGGRSAGLAAVLLLAPALAAAEVPTACPSTPARVVRSAGGVVDYLGSVPGLPELCRMRRTADGEGDFYLGFWRTDWPGAGQAYPAIRAAMHGPVGTRTRFVTRSVPGLQWTDSYTNEGVEAVSVNGESRPALRLAHEREGIEGNTYHSVITQWKDIATGMVLKTVERQISGQSYGPNTTWQATRIEPLR